MSIEKNIAKHQEQIRNMLLNTILPTIHNPFQNLDYWLIEYINRSVQLISRLNQLDNQENSIRVLLEHSNFRAELLSFLNELAGERKTLTSDTCLADYQNALEHFTSTLPKYWITHQCNDRFTVQTNDTLRQRLIKAAKRLGFKLYSIPQLTANLFRRLFRKNQKPVKPWKQKVPVKKLSLWLYGNKLIELFAPIIQQVYKDVALISAEIWKLDDKLFESITRFALNQTSKIELIETWEKDMLPGLNSLVNQISRSKKIQEESLTSLMNELDIQFQQQATIAGTLEFNWFEHLERKRIRELRRLKSEYSKGLSNRFNTLYALSDDWKFDQEVYILTCNVQKTALQQKFNLLSSQNNVLASLEAIPLYLENTRSSASLNDLENLRKSLQLLKSNADKTLVNKLLKDALNCILEQEFPLILDSTEQKLIADISTMTQKRVLIPNFDPSQAYSKRALTSITPKELIDFEMAVELKRSTLKIKKECVEQIDAIQHLLDDIGRLVIFNFETAIAIIDEQGENALEQSHSDAIAGLARASQKYADVKAHFESFIAKVINDFQAAIDQFSTSLLELTDNTHVEKIRFRIAKAKALKRGEQILTLLLESGKSGVSKILGYYRLSRKQVDAGIKTIRRKLGIQGLAKNISVEISEYLATSESAFQGLPFVYRRLFANEPLTDSMFYLSRKPETEKLLEAFTRWQMGSYMPVLIVGEKGSGISTFLKIFTSQNFKKKPQIFTIKATDKITYKEQLLALLGLSFRGEAFAQCEELYAFASLQERFIVQLDKLHLLFIRKPGGFNALKLLFEIISNTNHSIFWICTSGLYASKYLDKTISLYGYFPVVIQMQNLSINQIESIITLRHKTSGYYLTYLPSKQDLTDRNFKKRNDKDKQTYLKLKYYNQLNKQTESNVAFALQLWLRSISKIENNTCYINSLDGVDFSFLYTLPAEVVFALHNLIVHETLSPAQLASILNISNPKAELLLMQLNDRAIVIEYQGYFSVHPLLYRQTITLLQDKNLIH
ncbi:MAG: hypothetical protein RBT74_13645 [Tenuifilaceae bacterium]|nr:hypothetical protein [Tenuifilaceae bacterium]